MWTSRTVILKSCKHFTCGQYCRISEVFNVVSGSLGCEGANAGCKYLFRISPPSNAHDVFDVTPADSYVIEQVIVQLFQTVHCGFQLSFTHDCRDKIAQSQYGQVLSYHHALHKCLRIVPTPKRRAMDGSLFGHSRLMRRFTFTDLHYSCRWSIRPQLRGSRNN